MSTIRPGRGKEWLNALKNELLESVEASSAKITVHCGSWEHDLFQAKLLPDKVSVSFDIFHFFLLSSISYEMSLRNI
jgi:hypothetical protein